MARFIYRMRLLPTDFKIEWEGRENYVPAHGNEVVVKRNFLQATNDIRQSIFLLPQLSFCNVIGEQPTFGLCSIPFALFR